MKIDLSRARDAESKCKEIADKVLAYTKRLYDYDNEGVIYAEAYRALRRDEIISRFTEANAALCENAGNAIAGAAAEVKEATRHIDLNAADLTAALDIINAGTLKPESLVALEDVFRGRRQAQLVLNSALEAHNLGTIEVFNPGPVLDAAEAAIRAAGHYSNPSDLYRELAAAEDAFNEFFRTAGADIVADWKLPRAEMQEASMRRAMGI